MLDDIDSLESGTHLSCAVCIVGAGIAGITMALELERAGIDCIVLESGGLEHELDTSSLSDGETLGLPFQFDDGCRSRYFGGSSNCWGGWCRPFDPIDFETRDWVPHSGWPLDFDEMAPWYERSHGPLELGPPDFDPDRWITASGNSRLCRMVIPGGRIVDQVFQFSPPTRFGATYRRRLAQARHVRVVLHANVVELETDPDGTRVTAVDVRSLGGQVLRVAARAFVLAAGGIENVRLLLNSTAHRPSGLANDHDQVGRYFMDHPRLCAGTVRLARSAPHPALYDQLYHSLNRAVTAHGVGFGGHFVLTPQAQRAEGILNSQTWFRSFAPGESSQSSKALLRLKLRSMGGQPGAVSLASDIGRVLADPLSAATFALTRKLHLTSWIREIRLNTIVEPAPDPDSRITLADDRDALGLRRATVDWRLGQLVRRTFDRTWAVLSEDLARAGIANVILPAPIEHQPWPTPESVRYYVWGHGKMLEQGDEWPRLPDWTWHHMGGTRMHASPRHGVVDRNLKVHGLANLWIAGSSVFPTGAANFPTMTIVALSLRLADHLERTVRGALLPEVAPQELG